MIYRIPYTFNMRGKVEVEADSLEEAIKKAENELIDWEVFELIEHADYIEDTLDLDRDENGNIEEYNEI